MTPLGFKKKKVKGLSHACRHSIIYSVSNHTYLGTSHHSVGDVSNITFQDLILIYNLGWVDLGDQVNCFSISPKIGTRNVLGSKGI